MAGHFECPITGADIGTVKFVEAHNDNTEVQNIKIEKCTKNKQVP